MKTFNNRDWSSKTHSNFCIEEKATIDVTGINNRIYTLPINLFDDTLHGNGNNGLFIHDESGDLFLFHYRINQLKPANDDISIANDSNVAAYTIRDVLLDDNDNTSVATVGYVKSLLNNTDWIWKADVISKTSTVPDTPSDGDRYLIVGSTPGGAWEGHLNDIAEWDSGTSTWIFETPEDDPLVKWAVRTTDNGHIHLWDILNSLAQWVDLGGMFSYYQGNGILIDGTTISFVAKTDGGLNVGATGAYIDFVSPFYVDANHKFNFKYSEDHFAVGTYEEESGVFLPLQLTTATAPITAIYNESTHLTDISFSYNFPFYTNAGKFDLKVNPVGGIEVDGTAGLQLKIATDGGILLSETGEISVDPNITGIDFIEEFSFTTTDDHIFSLPSAFTNSASANFTLFYKVGTGSSAYYEPTEFDFRVYTSGSNILNVLVPYDASMAGYTFRIVAKA